MFVKSFAVNPKPAIILGNNKKWNMAFGYLSKIANDVSVLISSSVGGKDEDSNLCAYLWRIHRSNVVEVRGGEAVDTPARSTLQSLEMCPFLPPSRFEERQNPPVREVPARNG